MNDFCMFTTFKIDFYLDVTVAPSEKSDDGEAAYDDYLEDQICRSHDPVESDDAWAVICAYVTSFRAR